MLEHRPPPLTPTGAPPPRRGHIQIYEVCEIAQQKRCHQAVVFETRKKTDMFMWVGRVPAGPSVKFAVLNAHTMSELRMTGNALRGSRPVSVFSAAFDESPALRLIKEMLLQTFSVPHGAPGSKPFIDHVMSWLIVDGKIWFRQYQVVDAQRKARRGDGSRHDEPVELVEMGPQMVLDPVRILEGAFSGNILWDNPDYVSQNAQRAAAKARAATTYQRRAQANKDAYHAREARRGEPGLFDTVFGDSAVVIRDQ